MKTARKYSHSGKLKTLAEWAALKGLDVTTLRTRVNAGWPKSRWFEQARAYWKGQLQSLSTKPDGREG